MGTPDVVIDKNLGRWKGGLAGWQAALLFTSVGQHSERPWRLLWHEENLNSSSQASLDPIWTLSLAAWEKKIKIASGSLQVLRADRVSVTAACECSRALEVTQAFVHVSWASIFGGCLLGPMAHKAFNLARVNSYDGTL